MAGSRDAGRSDRVDVSATLIGVGALLGAAYLCDRTYRRWLKENHPFAEHRARMRRLSTGYQRKRDNVKEVVDVVLDILIEVTRATASPDPRSIFGRDD